MLSDAVERGWRAARWRGYQFFPNGAAFNHRVENFIQIALLSVRLESSSHL
jgi:hypothetical protein